MVKLDVLEVGNFLAFNHLGGCQITTYLFQVLGAGSFHLNLAATVAWVYIVENLLAALAGVELDIAVKILVDVSDGSKLRQLQAQVIETGKLVGRLHGFCCLLETLAAEHEHRTEIEVIAQRAHLIVDNGGFHCTFVGDIIVVGIDHATLCVGENLHETLEGEWREFQSHILGVKHGHASVALLGDSLDGGSRCEVVNIEHLAAVDGALGLSIGKQIDFVY